MQSTWYFLRHGEIVEQGILCGRSDINLSPLGWQQLEDVMKGITAVTQIFSSPLVRCSKFATKISEQRQLSVEIVDDLQEMDFGLWDGKPFEWLWCNTDKPSIGDFWADPWSHTPQDAESMTNFHLRVQTWWQSQLAIPNDECSLVITHAGVIKQLLAMILQFPSNSVKQLSIFDVGYASVIKVQVYYDEQGVAWPKVVF
ncbi:histidine phosphatase family protein [Pseudoalteromonas sp. MMG012]|uniref:histidine phosphatase family protein n=1 Tax=Pseudoalteromonas sp. MMG012 TaxID=2822686 RepID=UPI001B3A6260|nr:histidine phosphatase family protein [Pseudoalteromonas sp. MMG012]MBQ4848639.1 histidine phosphatase family protein [Pseudoalteromonas sp. MMG012]